MRAGARVEVAPYKRDPMDFVLWKPSDATQPGWDSPWGRGRPGWHIECSAMAHDLLGPSFDIHGGGIDLVFPHHENEAAQSRCAHPEGSFANIWMHNGFVNVEGEKMSKSLGNFFTVRDLLDKGVPGEVIRFVLLSTHYRSPMDFTDAKVQEATETLTKWYKIVGQIEPNNFWDTANAKRWGIIGALENDLNTPLALKRIHSLAGFAERGSEPHQRWLKESAMVLGLLEGTNESFTESVRREVDEILIQEIKNFVRQRSEARALRNFSRADEIRDALTAAGVELKDVGEETTFEVTRHFDRDRFGAVR